MLVPSLSHCVHPKISLTSRVLGKLRRPWKFQFNHRWVQHMGFGHLLILRSYPPVKSRSCRRGFIDWPSPKKRSESQLYLTHCILHLSMTRANLSRESALFRFFRVLFKLNGVYFDSLGKLNCYLARTEQFLYLSPVSFTGSSMFETDRNEGRCVIGDDPFLESPGNYGAGKPFLIHLCLKTEKCIRLKLLVWRDFKKRWIKQLCNHKVWAFRMRKLFGTFKKRAPVGLGFD